MDEKKVREAIAWMENERRIHKYGTRISPSIPKEQISKIGECYDLAIEALEKQLPKKVDFEEDVTEDVCVECHSCGCFLGYQVDCLDENYQIDYCKHCGQRIDWSE